MTDGCPNYVNIINFCKLLRENYFHGKAVASRYDSVEVSMPSIRKEHTQCSTEVSEHCCQAIIVVYRRMNSERTAT